MESDAEEPVRLDLLVRTDEGGTRCVSMPLFTSRPEDRWEHADKTAYFNRGQYLWLSEPIDELDHQFGMSLGLGRWFDSLLLSASVGAAGSVCPRTMCPPIRNTVDGETKESTRVAAGPAFTVEGSTWPLQYGFLSGGIAARYLASHVSSRTHEGNQTLFVHGPLLVPKLGLAELPYLAPGLPGGAHTSVFEIEAPVGLIASNRTTLAVAYGLGINLAVTVW